MRKPPRLYAHDAKGMIPRMSWSPHNLYNLIARSTVPANVADITFQRVSSTMYQQRWRSKRFLRGYHGDWIGERRFRRWYLPTTVPRFDHLRQAGRPSRLTSPNVRSSGAGERGLSESERLPVTSLFLREVERRLDTAVFRCCFARSAREARSMIVSGKVKLNGQVTTLAGTLLNPGDLLTVEPSSIPMLSPTLEKLAAEQKEARLTHQREQRQAAIAERKKEEEGLSAEGEKASAEDESAEEAKVAEQAEEEDAAEGKNEDSEAATEASRGVAEAAEKVEKESTGGTQVTEKSYSDKKTDSLPPGVLPFNLPPFASPFLFVPPYLEVSFSTCSAIYMRHPTITPVPRSAGSSSSVAYHSDIPSPYPATGDIFSLAWEMYVRDAPRIRSDVRRVRLEARVGRNGLRTARARDQWRKLLAIRRKRDRQDESDPSTTTATKIHNTQFSVGGRRTNVVKRKHAVPLAKQGNRIGTDSVGAEERKATNT